MCPRTPIQSARPVPNWRSPASPRPGHDVALVVELAVERRAVDRDIRVGSADRLDAFRRGDQVDQLDPDRLDGAPFLEHLDGGRGRAAGRQHRVEDQAQVDGRRVGQLVVVLDRAERPFVAEQPEMPHLGGRHELQHRVDHAEPCAQDRHEPDPLAELTGLGVLERGRHGDRRDAHVLQGLVAEQPRQLAHDLPELLRLRLLVAQDRELVEDGRMPRHVEIRGGHGDLRAAKSEPAGTVRSIVAKALPRPVGRMTADFD